MYRLFPRIDLGSFSLEELNHNSQSNVAQLKQVDLNFILIFFSK